MAQVKKLSTAFTIPSGMTASPLPLLLASAGRPGYSSRYVPNTLPGADGSAVSAITSTVDTSIRTLAAAGSAEPTLKVVGTDKYIHFDGVDDFLSQTSTGPAWKSAAFLMRGHYTWNAAANAFGSRGSTGYLNINFGSGSGGGQVAAGPDLGATYWSVGIFTQNGAASTVSIAPCNTAGGSISATRSTVTGTLGTGAATKLEIGRSTTPVYSEQDVAEWITWDDAITLTTDLDAIVAALIASHRDLILSGL